MKNRNRQFSDVRNKNLENTSIINSNNSAFYKNKACNQSLTTSFLKKSRPDVCVTCVNKTIAMSKKTKQTQQKERLNQEIRAQMERRNNMRDINQENRQRLRNEAKIYNKSLMNTHRQSIKSQKLLNTKYLQEVVEKQEKQLQQQSQRIQHQKQMELKYRKDLYRQYKEAEQIRLKTGKRQSQPLNSLPLKNLDRTEIIKRYQAQLKNQMIYNDMAKRSQRQKQINDDKKVLQQSQRQFEKFTQFLSQTNPLPNPEVFEELKLMDYSKKIKKIEDRELKQKERREQLIKQKQLYKSETQLRLKIKQNYESTLKKQMTEKKVREAAEKEKEKKKQQQFYKYTEDVLKESRRLKACEQCHHQYEDKCLI